MTSYTYARIEEGHIPGLMSMTKQVFGYAKDHAYWKWKHFGNPVGPSLSTVILHGGSTVGFLGIIPVRFAVAGKEVTAVQGIDLAIHEQHRRLDVFLGMLDATGKRLKEAGIAFSYGISDRNISEFNQAFNGTRKVSDVPRLVKVLNTAPVLKRRFSNQPAWSLVSPLLNGLLRLRYRRKAGVPAGMEIRSVDRFDARFDRFWNRIKNDYQIMTVRDSSYLNWRYRDPVQNHYSVFSLESAESSEIAGFAVLGEKKEDSITRGQILDLVTPRTSTGHASCLLHHAVERFVEKKADVVDCWMYRHAHAHAALLKYGFIPRDDDAMELSVDSIEMKECSIDPRAMKDLEKWFLAIGDSDVA